MATRAISNFEILDQTAHLLKGKTEDKQTKAFQVFSKASEEVKGIVYESLFKVMAPIHSYWGFGEDAFHNNKGVSSTSDQKAQAIEAGLSQLIAQMKLKGAPNLRDLHYFLGSAAEAMMGIDPARGMQLFDKLPLEVREGVYEELFSILPFDHDPSLAADAFHDRKELTSTAEQKSLAIYCYLLKSIQDLFSREEDHALALELFRRLPEEHCKGVDLGDTQGKAQAIENYLRTFKHGHRTDVLGSCLESLEALLPQESLEEIATEARLTAEDVAEEANSVDMLFTPAGVTVNYSYGFSVGLSNYKDRKFQIAGQLYIPISGGTQGFSQKRLVSIGSTPARELLFLDPDNCGELKKSYQELRQTLSAEMSTEQILLRVKDHVRAKVFHDRGPRLLERVNAMIAEAAKGSQTVKHAKFRGSKIPLMSMVYFILHGIGLPRHYALADCYMIDSLLQEENPLIEGTVQLLRGNLEKIDGAHYWVAFIPKRKSIQRRDSQQRAWKLQTQSSPEKWHLDSFRDVLLNFADGRQRIQLRELYDDKIIEQEVEQTAAVAKSNDQPET